MTDQDGGPVEPTEPPLAQILKDGPAEFPPELLSIISETYSGPTPHPEHLRQYEEIAPGSAQQMIDMAHDQARHRQHLEKVVVEGNDKRATHGLYLGWFIAVVVLAFGFVLVLQGRNLAGFITLIAEAATLAGVFVFGRLQQKKERIAKAKLSTPPSPPAQPELPFGER